MHGFPPITLMRPLLISRAPTRPICVAKEAIRAMMSAEAEEETRMATEPWNFDVPTQLRQFAEQSLEQARKAVDGFMDAAQKAVTTAESQATVAQSGAKDIGQKAMTFAEQNVANSFDFAQKLVRAKDMQEIMALQQEFLQSQMRAMSEQAKDLGSAASRTATDALQPKK
jgi:phasin